MKFLKLSNVRYYLDFVHVIVSFVYDVVFYLRKTLEENILRNHTLQEETGGCIVI